MKIRFALLAAALVTSQALAADATTPDLATEPILSKARLTGSLTAGAATNYSGRGYVTTPTATQGSGLCFGALKLNYDLGEKDKWSIDSMLAYTAPTSGHTLYGGPTVMVPVAPGVTIPHQTPKLNIENEFAVITAAKYKEDEWNISFGHDFVHGGLLGVMAKHFRDQGASCTNEVFVTSEWTPTSAKWFLGGMTVRYSFMGVQGWWFEPYVTFKAPIIGTPEDVTLAAIATFSLSATSDYYNEGHFACQNGTQAFWIKLSTPWFVTDNFILTPSVSFNWLGKGGMKANKRAELKSYLGDRYVPFKRFGVVGGLSATYTF